MSDVHTMVKYVRPNGGDVEFGAHAREVLMQMRQLDDDAPESGGVLLGRLVVSTEDVVVDEVTTPGPYDKGSRYLFRRSRRSAQPRVTAAWHGTDGTRIYLGDWHSHPENEPHSSSIDRRDWSRTLQRATYEQDFLLFAIVGQQSIAIWEGRHVGRRSTVLERCAPVANALLIG